MAGRLSDKIAIVTGGSKGIGRGIASVFSREGAVVIIASRNPDAGLKAAGEINASGGETVFMQTDVSVEGDMAKTAFAAVQQYGRIDILCHNAGVYSTVYLDEMDVQEWDAINAVNLRGSFLSLQAVLPQMKRQRKGRILFTTSITGPKTGIPGQSHYAATKAGMNGLIHSSALELAKYNITINGVEPGNILTEGLEALGSDHIDKMVSSIPLGRLGNPEDVAHAMLFFASDDASWITGTTLVVDGGQVLPEAKL
jgi:3-oxoacyl-[acyl-carrier protein] reductase